MFGAQPPGGVSDERCGTPTSETPAAVVRPQGLARSSSALPTQWRRFLWTTSNKRGWGALRLTTIGRKSGQERSVIVGHLEDGPNLISTAMNGWDEGHPSWWLNLEAHPDAVVRLNDQHPRPVRARPAVGQERDRLWQRWTAVDPRLDGYASQRSTETPVIIFEPRGGTA
jgi:F420H(2)-dependent quinone reductase